jgi:hypothetical protein
MGLTSVQLQFRPIQFLTSVSLAIYSAFFVSALVLPESFNPSMFLRLTLILLCLQLQCGGKQLPRNCL